MSLVFPRRMPVGVAGQYFEAEQVDYQTAVAGGRVNGVTAGPPLWHGRWTLGAGISQSASDQWRAFLSAQRGQQRPFLGYDQARPYPRSTPNGFAGMARHGGGAFDGTATSWSINSDGDELALNGLPSSLALTFGDYAMLRWTTGGDERRSLHRAVDAATAIAGVVTLSIYPPVPDLVPGDAVADLAQPCCVMKLTPETKIGEMGRSLRVAGQVVAIQDLRE
ncbi:MAG: hypothetical protein Q8S03_10170 [Brevundimonas sp.]|uniref:hypothetical protein n=1 Tax=Brevundimonas sp. TaxID=1871086 RepID=UPI0027351029|nr:hypothetical protein [Brevundimonas sp.]MDP3405044.1 hypothetical protein [Brevundimonas sp.]